MNRDADGNCVNCSQDVCACGDYRDDGEEVNIWGERIIPIYYIAPSDEMFEKMRGYFLQVWKKYESCEGIVNDTIEVAKKMDNVRDNFMWFLNKCDCWNKVELLNISDKEVRKYWIQRMSVLDYNFTIMNGLSCIVV